MPATCLAPADSPATGPPPARGAEPFPFGSLSYFLLAGALHMAVVLLCSLPVIEFAFLQLAWAIGPYRDFPLPHDRPEWSPSEPRLGELAPVAIVGTVFLATVITVLHLATLAAVVLAHRWRGWPAYWKDVRPRVSLPAIWSRSARQSWWVWPVCQAVWLLIEQTCSGLQYAFPGVISSAWPYWPVSLFIPAVGFALGASAALRREVAGAVGPEDVRCRKCGYLLRGIDSARCPECGTQREPFEQLCFGLRWGPLRYVLPRRRVTLFTLAAALLLAPLWVPPILLNLPPGWLRPVPRAILPRGVFFFRNPNDLPIRLDAVCIIRYGGALARVQFFREAGMRARYQALYWADETAFGRAPADQEKTGVVKNGGGPFLMIGGWTFRYNAVSETMLWLTRPDPLYEVRAFKPDQAPETFQQLTDDRRRPR